MKFLIFLTLLFTLSCASTPKEKYQSQLDFESYCSRSEGSLKKQIALGVLEAAAGSQGIDLSLQRGRCEEYYNKRDIDYRRK